MPDISNLVEGGLKSPERYEKARRIIIDTYLPVINEAITSERKGLKPINPEDLIILDSAEFAKLTSQFGNTLCPEIEGIVRDFLAERGSRDVVFSTSDPRVEAATVLTDYGPKILLNGEIECLSALNDGVAMNGNFQLFVSRPELLAISMIPLLCHEDVHYSVSLEKFGNDSGLAEFARRVPYPVIRGMTGILTETEFQAMTERVHNYVSSRKDIGIRCHGALVDVFDNSEAAENGYLGAFGTNLDEALTEWFAFRIKKRSVDLFLQRHPELSPAGTRNYLLSKETHTAIGAFKTYTSEQARNQLRGIGLYDFSSMLKAYLTSTIPERFVERMPDATSYF